MQDATHRSPPIISSLLSLALVVLVASAIAGARPPLFLAINASALIPAFILWHLFANSRLLSLAFVNLVAVYASVFALFADEVFEGVGTGVLALGFLLPIVMFLLGCWWRQAEVGAEVAHPTLAGERGITRAIVWLAPVFLVGLTVLVLSRLSQPLVDNNLGFLAAMLLIGLIVMVVSRDVATFLVDVGLLFEEFFGRVRHLLVPAFAFLTFYSLLVVVFASVYSLVSRFGIESHFRVALEMRPLSFAESLHFSITTLSTVGYGDIVPLTSLTRTIAAIQVVCGTLLLLFGVSEILEYARERRRPRRRSGHED